MKRQEGGTQDCWVMGAEGEGGSCLLSPVLGTYPQLSQVPDPMWQVPEDQAACQECPLAGKGMCAQTSGRNGFMGKIPRSAWDTGVRRGIGAEIQCQRAGGDWVCTSAAVCGTLREPEFLGAGDEGAGASWIPPESPWLVLPSVDWELSRLQRQCKVMEGERRAYSKEVHQRINKQL